jgi:hypothetical protein
LSISVTNSSLSGLMPLSISWQPQPPVRERTGGVGRPIRSFRSQAGAVNLW